jgi:hypothetical protein
MVVYIFELLFESRLNLKIVFFQHVCSSAGAKRRHVLFMYTKVTLFRIPAADRLLSQTPLIRELAQKPHELHAAFGHCTKPHAEIKFEVTEKPSRWKGSWTQGQV